MTLAILIVAIAAMTCLWAFLIAYFVNIFTVPGTKLRFVMRAIQRPTQWVAVLWFVAQVGLDTYERDTLYVLLDLWNIGWISFSIRAFYRDDEDDMWKRGKKKLKKFARKLARRARESKARVLAPVGSAA